jgi:hypothetical protein
MPALTKHHSSKTTKLLFIGDSGSGKTGALASLAAAGYNLRIIDVDNGIDVLKNYLTNPDSAYYKQNPKAAENVRYVTFTEKKRNLSGRLVPATATVWQKTINMLADWKEKEEDGTEFKLGPITTWTPQDVLVIDSLSFLSEAALNFHLMMNSALAAVRTQNEARRDIGAAQNLLRDLLGMLFDESVKCNVIVTSHITFVNDTGGKPGAETPEEKATMGTPNGYPSAIGRALSPHIPRYFNSMLIARTNLANRREIFTISQSVGGQIINAKSSAPLAVKPKYPLETGLADYFKAVRGE